MISPHLEGLKVPVTTGSFWRGSPRRGDVEAVKRSYARFGQQKPIVARHDGDESVVIAGDHQLLAARALGWTHIAVTGRRYVHGDRYEAERERSAEPNAALDNPSRLPNV